MIPFIRLDDTIGRVSKLFSQAREGTEMENMSASSEGIVSPTSITSLYLQDPSS